MASPVDIPQKLKGPHVGLAPFCKYNFVPAISQADLISSCLFSFFFFFFLIEFTPHNILVNARCRGHVRPNLGGYIG